MNVSDMRLKRMCHGRGTSPGRGAFTLVEVMLSMAVLAIMLLLIANIIGTTQRSWRSASARLSQFREARIAFDTLARNLRQTTLNTYRAYRYNNPADPLVPAVESVAVAPEGYIRASELAFRCGQASTLVGSLGSIGQPVGHAVFFQAPLGVTDETRYENLKNLLCVRGYFVVLGDDEAFLPDALFQAGRLSPTTRLRLMEYQPPAENNQIYANPNNWIDIGANPDAPDYLRPVSENIAALIISPRLSAGDDPVPFAGGTARPTSIAPNYTYDSTKVANVTTSDTQGSQHILPPVIKLAMIALDGNSLGSPGATEAIDALSKGSQFINADNYENDLKQVEDTLNRARVNYRIFETSVVIPASKWTL